MAKSRYTVTVTDEKGTVVFQGTPSGNDSFRITKIGSAPARLVCNIGDLSNALKHRRKHDDRNGASPGD